MDNESSCCTVEVRAEGRGLIDMKSTPDLNQHTLFLILWSFSLACQKKKTEVTKALWHV